MSENGSRRFLLLLSWPNERKGKGAGLWIVVRRSRKFCTWVQELCIARNTVEYLDAKPKFLGTHCKTHKKLNQLTDKIRKIENENKNLAGKGPEWTNGNEGGRPAKGNMLHVVSCFGFSSSSATHARTHYIVLVVCTVLVRLSRLIICASETENCSLIRGTVTLCDGSLMFVSKSLDGGHCFYKEGKISKKFARKQTGMFL